MAQYEHLPIYKKAYELTIYFEKIVRSFSRYNKYTHGTELRELSRQVMQLIRRANDAEDKVPFLLENRERLEDWTWVRTNGPQVSGQTAARAAWAVNFNNGNCNHNDVGINNNHVRAVR